MIGVSGGPGHRGGGWLWEVDANRSNQGRGERKVATMEASTALLKAAGHVNVYGD